MLNFTNSQLNKFTFNYFRLNYCEYCDLLPLLEEVEFYFGNIKTALISEQLIRQNMEHIYKLEQSLYLSDNQINSITKTHLEFQQRYLYYHNLLSKLQESVYCFPKKTIFTEDGLKVLLLAIICKNWKSTYLYLNLAKLAFDTKKIRLSQYFLEIAQLKQNILLLLITITKCN